MIQNKNLLRNIMILFMLIPLIHGLVLIGFQDDILLGRVLLITFAMIVMIPYAKSMIEQFHAIAEFKMQELEEKLRIRLRK